MDQDGACGRRGAARVGLCAGVPARPGRAAANLLPQINCARQLGTTSSGKSCSINDLLIKVANRGEGGAVAGVDQAIANELVITVYLDTNALLDLLATVEDGFTLVERVTSGETAGGTSERSAEASFGAPGVFNFFKLGLSGKLAKSTNDARNDTTESEITHTYGSLLHRLRRYLIEEGLITTVPSGSPGAVQVGKFIEFTGVVRPNPFTASFRQLQRMLNYVSVAAAFEGKSSPSQRPGGRPQNRSGGGGSGGQSRPTASGPTGVQIKAMGDFFEQLTADVEREGTSTVLLQSETSNYQAIVTLYDDFLRDRSMAELLNREFRVLGKVARHLPEGSSEKVDLLASSGIAGFSPELLGSLSQGVDEMSRSGGASLATPSTVIEPPVVEIVPIAIYL